MRTPEITLDALQREMERAMRTPDRKSGASYVHLDTRVLQWMLDDLRALKLQELEAEAHKTGVF